MAVVLLKTSFSCWKVTIRSMRTGLLADYSGPARTTNSSMEPPEWRVSRATKCCWGLSFLSLDFLLSEVVSLLQVRKRARFFWLARTLALAHVNYSAEFSILSA